MHEILAALLIAANVTLQGLSALPRLGSVAKELTSEDLDEITRLVSTSGRRPWLLVADKRFLPGPRQWYVFVYLEPHVATPSVRRGPILIAFCQGNVWNLEASASWAQAAVAGRTFEEVAGERDVNRPFQVIGDLSNEEIFTAITFIRTSPKNPTPHSPLPGLTEPAAILSSVKGHWPVSRMARNADGTVQIDLQEHDHSGQSVTLSRADGKWKLTQLRVWISG